MRILLQRKRKRMLKESNIKEVMEMKTLKEFLEAFQNENYKISIVNGNRVSSDEDHVLITTDKKYKDCIKDKILNLTVSGFAINDYDERLVIEVTTQKRGKKMIIEVKTVEILAKQKMQFEATTVVKEEKLIKFMTGFKNSSKETRNDGYIKEVALHLGVDESNNLILREYAKVILNPLFMHSNEKIEEIIQEMKKVEEKIEKVF